MIKRTVVAALVLLALAGVGGCGKKGLLDVPEGSSYPQPYPRP
ncbi:MAG: hypothetical protein AB7E79_12015 [Rhodospirillaceae bacterium]